MRPRSALTWRISAGYTAWITVLAVGYFFRPEAHLVTWALIGLTCVGAIAVGIVLHRPAYAWPWVLIGAANLAYTAGDTTYNVMTTILGAHNPFPSVADVQYLATYPLFAAGLIGFIRYRTGRDRGGLLDALIVTTGIALLYWIFLIEPQTGIHDGLTKITSIAYPLGDVLMLAMLARLVFSPDGVRNASVRLLALGTVGILTSDVLYGLIQLHGDWYVGTPVDVGWLIFYWAWGLAALHPAMVGLTEPLRRSRRSPLPVSRVVLIGAASLIPPAVLIAESWRGNTPDATVIGVFSVVLFGLVIARLAGVVTTHRHAVDRERALRQSAAALVSAVNSDQIVAELRDAAGALLPAGSPRRALLALRHGDLVAEVTEGSGPAWSMDVAGPAREVLLGEQPGRVMPVEDLGLPLASRFTGFTNVLVYPLATQRTVGDPPAGLLLVGAGKDALIGAWDALVTLAAQVALAVERVALAEEVDRRNSEAYFRTLVHNAFDVILIVDDHDTVRYASPSAASMFDHRPVLGTSFPELVLPEDRDRVRTSLDEMRGQDGDGHDEWRLRSRDESAAHVEVRYSDLRRDPTVHGLVLTLRDVTAQRELEKELSHRAFHDALTGLPNRLLFTDRVEHALARARRTGRLVAVLLIDLDDFKMVNDTMGHPVGDELLITVAARLTGSVRESDTPARLGGDEFALLAEDVATMADVERLAEELTRTLGMPFRLGAGVTRTSASIGVATSAESETGDDLLRHADLALYAAKAAGRRQWCRFQPHLHTGMMERRALQLSLEEAVQGAEFRLRYQPIVELSTGRIVGFEALARWPTSRHGVLLPDRFIALAEETGHIVQLGAWVLDQATRDVAGWRAADRTGSGLRVSVNMSARQLREPGVVDLVRDTLASADLPADALLLELTESILMGRDDTIEADLRALKQLGVGLAIDDFGTGYSSLSYLRQLPIDMIKIDKSFVGDIARSSADLRLTDGIVRIAATLGLSAVAEGIETAEQRDLLAGIGCRYGQGYLFSRPLPPEEIPELLRTTNG
ncbi:MAG TPA: EAL domain-containing protein [Actinocatenispora sp.]